MRRTRVHFCQRCGFERHFTRPTMSHGIHLVGAICSFGLWIIPWIVISVKNARQPWRCTFCATKWGKGSGRSTEQSTATRVTQVKVAPRRSAVP